MFLLNILFSLKIIQYKIFGEGMKINWFPGHMHKALKEIKEELKKVDVVLYVLDARIPLSSLNTKLDELLEYNPVLYL